MKKLFLLLASVLIGMNVMAELTQDGEGVYQIGSAQDLVDFGAKVNAGEQSINAVLTADIDMSSVENMTPIGLFGEVNGATNGYLGQFDGRGFVISDLTISVAATNEYTVGLFGRIGSGCTISNVILVDAYIENPSGKTTGALVGWTAQGGVKNCAVINPSFDSGDATIANLGGIVGFMANNAASSLTGSWTNYAKAIGTKGAKSTDQNNQQAVGAAAMSSGELCYQLNGDQSAIIWRQTLGDDDYPTTKSTSSQVYKNGTLGCDGTEKSVTYENEDKGLVSEEHQIADGICQVCGSYDPKDIVDGTYQIGTPAQLQWFSAFVNEGNRTAKAALKNDIDMSSVAAFDPIGRHIDPENGTHTENDFAGTFDGQGHVIKNLTVSTTNGEESGLFGRLQGSVTRLGIENASITSATGIRSGVLAGLILNSSGVKNCYTSGTLSVSTTNAEKAPFANITAFGQNTSITGCYTTGDSFGTLSPISGSVTTPNSFCGADVASMGPTGELCFKLNGESSENPIWFQAIGTDNYPSFDSAKGIVYLAVDQKCDGTPKGEATYGNTAGTRDPHQLTDGVCTVCGEFDPADVIDGVYQIGTPAQLVAFGKKVNAGNQGLNAVLKNDIDMAGIENFEPIGKHSDTNGTSITYRGKFDGQGYVIKNLTVTCSDSWEVGLFSRVIDATIQNLGIVNATMTSQATIRTGVLAGIIIRGTTKNVFTTGDITINTDHSQKGGIAGTYLQNFGTGGAPLQNAYTTYDTAYGDESNGEPVRLFFGAEAVAQAPTGELCYKLGQDLEDPVFFQTLGTDTYPVLNKNSKPVYEETLGEEKYYTNVEGLPCKDGIFLIGTPAQLVAFSAYVNGTDRAAKAQLVADIDMSEVETFTPIGTYINSGDLNNIGITGVETLNNSYTGTFDGQFHVIRNINVVATQYAETGLFSRIWNGTVKNLGVENIKVTNPLKVRTGAFAGFIYRSTVENCYVAGTVQIVTPDTAPAGFACSASSSNLTNCYSTYEGAFTPENSGTPKNCHSYSTNANIAADAQSGALCYALNEGAGQTIFYQTLGENGDAHPVFDTTHGQVYKQGSYNCDGTPKEGTIEAYTNDPEASSVDEHDLVDGICSKCGAYDPSQIEDGIYLISTPRQLCWFADIVNDPAKQAHAAKARLVADIDMSSVENFIPIGKYRDAVAGAVSGDNHQYQGVFDGNRHIISNLTIKDEGYYEIGLFGRTYKATVKDLGVVNASIQGNNPSGRIGAIAGFNRESTFQNCFATGELDFTAASGNQIGGIAGQSNNGNAKYYNCWTTYPTLVTGSPTISNSGTATAEEAASGEVAYVINQAAGEFIYLQNVGTDPYPSFQGGFVAKIADNGYGTFFCTDDAVVAPEDVTAYTGLIDGDVLKMTAIEGDIPAETPIVIQGEPGFCSFMGIGKAAGIGENDLKGAGAALTADGSQYILAEVDGTVGFYQATAQTKIPFAKAYLSISEAAGAKGFRMVFGDATGINEMTTDNRQQTTVIYDLQGRRVEKATKGIYIVNGKKVLK